MRENNREGKKVSKKTKETFRPNTEEYQRIMFCKSSGSQPVLRGALVEPLEVQRLHVHFSGVPQQFQENKANKKFVVENKFSLYW